MKTITLRLMKGKCKTSCPIPPGLILKTAKGIRKIAYDEKTGQATITYEEKGITSKEIAKLLEKAGYGVKR